MARLVRRRRAGRARGGDRRRARRRSTRATTARSTTSAWPRCGGSSARPRPTLLGVSARRAPRLPRLGDGRRPGERGAAARSARRPSDEAAGRLAGDPRPGRRGRGRRLRRGRHLRPSRPRPGDATSCGRRPSEPACRPCTAPPSTVSTCTSSRATSSPRPGMVDDLGLVRSRIGVATVEVAVAVDVRDALDAEAGGDRRPRQPDPRVVERAAAARPPLRRRLRLGVVRPLGRTGSAGGADLAPNVHLGE